MVLRVAKFFFGLSCLVAAADVEAAGAQQDSDLYKAVAFVTGTQEPERSRGFRNGLEQAVAKLTGRAGLIGSPRLLPYLDRVGEFVASYEYEDRMKGIPVHDEQGTRERPHFLRIVFAKAKLDDLLAQLSWAKWPLPRPRLAVLLAVGVPKGRYVLTRTGVEGYGQREVLKSVSEKRAVPTALPQDSETISVEDIESDRTNKIDLASRAAGGDCPLTGVLRLDAKGIYWNMRWTLRCQGKSETWSLDGVTYDTALASGLEESARLLSREETVRP